MEKAREFFTHTLRTPEALQILNGLEKPSSLDEALNMYADIARQLGAELTADEIKAYCEEKMNQPCAEGQVDDKELAQVAGGTSWPRHPDICKDTFNGGEFCWMTDSCTDSVILYRLDYDVCYFTFENGENCWYLEMCDFVIYNSPFYKCKRHENS